MANAGVLLKIYNDVTGDFLNIKDFNNKVIMQKIVYLLSELRIFVDDYRFAWDEYGPFSQKLQNDINEIKPNDFFNDIEFHEVVQNGIGFLKELLHSNNEYTQREWIEDIASCIYMKKYRCPHSSWEEILEKIQEKKEYLSNSQANKSAIDWCERILSYNLA